MNNYLTNYQNSKNLSTLVENRTIYSADHSELNIFETNEVAKNFALKFDFPVIASMLTGKKIMYLKGIDPFDFLPGESVILPSGEQMHIDFPLASKENPTQCLALAISPEKVKETTLHFNHAVALDDENTTWSIDSNSSHLTNQPEVDILVKRLVHTFTNNNKSKDVLLNLMIQELIIRLLQTKARYVFVNQKDSLLNDTRIGTVIRYIQNNMTEKNITVDTLAYQAHMSTSHFHRQFKNILGVSPIDYVNSERIKFAKKLIAENPKRALSDIAFLCGFNSVSYFNRQFKSHEMVSPSQYRKIAVKS